MINHLLVEGNGVTKEGVDDIGIVVQLLVDHEGEDSHLGGATVVKLDGKFLVDGLLIPSRCIELGSLDLFLTGTEAKFDEADEGDNLGDASGRDGVEGGKSVLDG